MKEGFDKQCHELPVPACQSQVKPPLDQGERCFGRCCGSAAGASVLGASLGKGGRQEEGRKDGLSVSACRPASCLLLMSARTNGEEALPAL